jgi:hypothetical protein
VGAGGDRGSGPGRSPELAAASPARGLEPASLVLAAALAASGVALLIWLSDLTFWRDEWAFLLHRRGLGADVFLDPHYEHIAIAPVAIYKALLAIFGMDSPTPFQLAAVAMFLTSVAVVFVYLRRRVGGWLALAGVLPILFLGPSWDDLLWPFQIGYFGSMAAGVGALLALEREDRAGDLFACALLAVSLSFSSVGIPFAVGVTVHVLTGGVTRRAWVALVPIVLYALWWLGFGSEAENKASFDNLLGAPKYVVEGFGSSIASLLGLATSREQFPITSLNWGVPLLLVAVVLAGVRLRRVGRVPRWLLVTLAIAVAFWALAGLNTTIGRGPDAGRYQYIGAIFLLLVAAELLRGVRIPRAGVIAALAVSVLATLSNVSLLEDYSNALAGLAGQQRAGLAAVELARDPVDPDLLLTQENSDVDYLGELDAGSYISAVDSYGSPAYSPAELAAAAEPSRAAADKVFAAALGLELAPGAPTATSCLVARPQNPERELALELPPGGALLRPRAGSRAELRVRRYATTSFPVDLGTLKGGQPATLRIPTDRSTEPWEAGLRASGPVEICRLAKENAA